MTQKEYSIQWGGRKLTLSTGSLAKQATASVEARYGDTVVLATVVLGGIRAGIDFFPLMVDFEERLYAAGKIKSSRFIKREGRPSDEAVLTGRLIDRSIRPLFPWELKNEVQVTSPAFATTKKTTRPLWDSSPLPPRSIFRAFRGPARLAPRASRAPTANLF
jgi:polyribonucleotide nucleotidyltransferase